MEKGVNKCDSPPPLFPDLSAALATRFPKALPFYTRSWVWIPDSLVGIYILLCIDDLIHPLGLFQ